MNDSKMAFAAILLLFLMLWVPLGQSDFLVGNWMKIGTYAVPFILLTFFSSRTQHRDSILADTQLMAVLLLVAYIIHQFEEHWVDLLGRQYAFYSDVNQLLLGVLGAPGTAVGPLTPEAIFVINTSLVWLIGAIAIWRSPGHVFPSLAMAGITLVNGISHIALGIAKQSYNPGLLTAVVIFLPLAIAFYRNALVSNLAVKTQVAVSIAWAILAHILMVAGLLAANWFGLISEVAYFVLLITWSVTPVLLFNTHSNISQILEETYRN